MFKSRVILVGYEFRPTHRSQVVEAVPPGDLVRESSRVWMVLVGVDLHVEGVGHDLAVLGQALGGQAGQDGPEGEEDGIGSGQEVDSAIMVTPH